MSDGGSRWAASLAVELAAASFLSKNVAMRPLLKGTLIIAGLALGAAILLPLAVSIAIAVAQVAFSLAALIIGIVVVVEKAT